MATITVPGSRRTVSASRRLTTTEDRIQAARRFYNSNVRDYNTRVETFPSRLIAAFGHFDKRDYFQVEPAIRDAGAPEIAG